MARPLRIEIPGGRYHITARGNERRDIFRDDRDREHFLELLAALPERFGTRLHAFMLMPNHFHLLLETPEANLSRTGQWLNVSYSVWFNRRHQRVGHLFQGRFAAAIIEDDANFQAVGRYLHLNPVRLKALGLGKGHRAATKRIGLAIAPSAQLVAQRLMVLRDWKWSSYPSYAGYRPAPPWLTCEVLGSLCGGRSQKQRHAAMRTYCEEGVREGLPERPWERLVGGLVLGSEEFADRLRKRLKINPREQRGLPGSNPVSWAQIVQAVASVKNERWEQFRDRHGDWGRDGALWLGRRMGRLTLRKLAELTGGLDYTTAGTAVSRFSRRLSKDAKLLRIMTRLQEQLSNVEM